MSLGFRSGTGVSCVRGLAIVVLWGVGSAACGSDAAGGSPAATTDGGGGTGGNDQTAGGSSGSDGADDADANIGGGGGATDGGASSGEAGPGIPDTAGGVYCLAEQADLTAAFYFGIKKQCVVLSKKDGDFTEMEKSAYEANCTSNLKGSVVDSCPAEGRVAYCSGNAIGSVTVVQTKVIYESPVNPSSEVVARNLLGICQGLPGYDLTDRMLNASCKGTLTAKVDGQAVDFSKQLTCQFKTDGSRMALLVRGSSAPNSADGKELTLYFLKTGDTLELKNELGQPGYGYLEGATAAGVFGTPVTGNMPSVKLDAFDSKGASVAGNFDLGTLGKSASSSGADARTISDGQLDLTFK